MRPFRVEECVAWWPPIRVEEESTYCVCSWLLSKVSSLKLIIIAYDSLRVTHEFLNFFYASGEVFRREQLATGLCDHNHIFNPNSSHFFSALLKERLVNALSVYYFSSSLKFLQVEVASWFHWSHHSCLQNPRVSQLLQIDLLTSFRCVLQIPSHILNIKTYQMSHSVREEQSPDSLALNLLQICFFLHHPNPLKSF